MVGVGQLQSKESPARSLRTDFFAVLQLCAI